MSDSRNTTRVAAIQLETKVGDWSENVFLAQKMVAEAAENKAQIVALPEFFTGALAPTSRAYDVVLPVNNSAVDMLVASAEKYTITVGGSMLVAEDGEIYNRYFLAEPDGQLHSHDKDIPTMWENAFYIGGNDDGVFQTGQGKVGAAVCWELIRTQTAKRLAGIDLAITGTHWWTLPSNWALANKLKPTGLFNRYLSENAPIEFSKRIGAPVIQASHCGSFSGEFPFGFGQSAPYTTHFVGGTQIVDAQGKRIAFRNTAEGPGIVYGDIAIGSVQPVLHDPMDRFWIPELPLLIKGYWSQQNVVNKTIYKKRGRQIALKAAEANRGAQL